MKTSRANTKSYRRMIKRLRIFDKLIQLGFLPAEDYRVFIREVRFKGCPSYNLFKNVIQ